VEAGQESEVATEVEVKPAAATDAEQSGVLSKEDLEAAAEAGKAKPKDPEADDADDPVKKLDPKSQERVNKKIKMALGEAKLKEAEAATLREEKAYLKGKLEALEASGMTKNEAVAVVAEQAADLPKMPRMKDFDDQDSYESALDQYQASLLQFIRDDVKRQEAAESQRRAGETRAQTAKRIQEEAETRELEDQGRVLGEVEKEFGKDAVEHILESAAGKKTWFTKTMRDATFSGEMPHKTLNFLATHQDIGVKIAGIKDPEQQRRAIYQLESAINNKVARVSGAPDPITKVEGKGSSNADESQMSDVEWHAYREKKKLSSA
ncbi:MAG: hypothetical protein ABIH23_20300, partial [bacterium]